MAARNLDATRVWARHGDELLLAAAAGLTDDDLRRASALPGWSVGNLVAHAAANGDALLNLVNWAKTGVRTPMYASPEDRAAGIAKGDTLSADDARAWLADSIAKLAAGFDGLTEAEWVHEVTTAQGRTVPATELPYMRSRESLIHAVDLANSLGRGAAFAELPPDFLAALIDDITAKRGTVPAVAGPAAERAAWLAGRPHRLAGAPELGPWL